MRGVSNPFLILPTNRAAKPGVHRSGYGPYSAQPSRSAEHRHTPAHAAPASAQPGKTALPASKGALPATSSKKTATGKQNVRVKREDSARSKVKTSVWSYGDSNPGPLACHPAAGRPPSSICAGHRPMASPPVPRNPRRLLYFPAVPVSPARMLLAAANQPTRDQPGPPENTTGRASREPGSGRDRQGPTIPSLPGRTTQFSLHSRQPGTAMTTPACSGSAVASAAPCIRSSGQRDINVRFCVLTARLLMRLPACSLRAAGSGSGAMTCHGGKSGAGLSAMESNGKEAGHGERRDPA